MLSRTAQEVENICHQYINAIRIDTKTAFKKRNENCFDKMKIIKRINFIMIKLVTYHVRFSRVKKDYPPDFMKKFL